MLMIELIGLLTWIATAVAGIALKLHAVKRLKHMDGLKGVYKTDQEDLSKIVGKF